MAGSFHFEVKSEVKMAIIKELSKEKFLEYALRGFKAVLEKELDIKDLTLTMSETVRQELIRKAGGEDKIRYPYAYGIINSVAATRDQQNNYAVRKNGQHVFNGTDKAQTSKAFLFPMDIGVEFHYVNSDLNAILRVAQSLAILSAVNGLHFVIKVGGTLEFSVRIEIPLETAINIQEEQNSQQPGGSEVTCGIILHTFIGFMRSVSAVNGSKPVLHVTIQSGDSTLEETFQLDG
jgi:hypothetical protein